jgi:hypothetical protein
MHSHFLSTTALYDPHLCDVIRHETRGKAVPTRGLEVALFGLVQSAIIEGLLAVGASALGVSTFNAVAGALTNALFFGAFIGASALLAPSAPKNRVRPPEAQRQTYTLEDGPRTVVLGRARVGGAYALRETLTTFDTYRLLAQCQGPTNGVEEYFVDDKPVVVDGSDGSVLSAPYYRGGKTYMWLHEQAGATNQPAQPQLRAVAPDRWTADHRLRGVATLLSRFKSPGTTNADYLKIWNGGYPTFDALRRGVSVYDPRNPAHDINNRSTWEWSDNGVLCAMWFVTAPELDGGFGLDPALFDWSDIAEQADLADDLIPAVGGLERRSVCSGSYTMDTPRGEILANIILSTGVQFVRLQSGLMSVRLDEDNAVQTVSLASKHISDMEWGGDEIATAVNEIKLYYVSPQRNWQRAELGISGKSWARDTESIEKTGLRSETIELLFCPQSGQAQRIARRLFARRRAARGEVKANLAGLMTMGHVTGTLDLSNFIAGYVPKVRFGSPRLEADEKSVTVPYFEEPALSAWNVSADEAAPPTPIEVGGGAVGAVEILAIKTVETAPGVLSLRVSHSESSGASDYEGTYRSFDGANQGPRLSMTEYPATRIIESEAAISIGQRFLVQARGETADGELGNFSPASDYTSSFDATPPSGLVIENVVTIYDQSGPTPFLTISFSVKCADVNVSTVNVLGTGASQTFASDSRYAKPNITYSYSGDVLYSGSIPSGQTRTGNIRLRAFNSTGQFTEINQVWSYTRP